ncbi:MAG: hypothetical protein QOC99_2669 [Acidobacteriota bacterium]|nr:hypothetical protein [Acidobacteriota bacterium]
MSFMFMPCMSRFFGVECVLFFRRRAARLFVDFAFEPPFRFDLAFGFDISMPGMFLMSCPCCCCALAEIIPFVTKINAMTIAQSLVRSEYKLFMNSPLKIRLASRASGQTCAPLDELCKSCSGNEEAFTSRERAVTPEGC